MIRVTENLQAVRAALCEAAKRADRPASEITLMAVSKRHDVAAMRQAIAAGQQHFGENFVSEALGKMAELSAEPLIWHFIGHIQSNKTREIAGAFDWVHTIDRERIARRLNDHRPSALGPLQVCLQVNIDNEPQKSGVAPEAVEALAAFVVNQPALRLRGLMCLPRPAETEKAQRLPFARLRELAQRLQRRHPQLDTLSMGMSGDLDAAIQEGATIVRVGSAIFGPRTAS